MQLLGFVGTPANHMLLQDWQAYQQTHAHQATTYSARNNALNLCLAGPHVAHNKDFTVAIKGTVHWQVRDHFTTQPPAHAVLAAYERWGEHLLAQLQGSFALVIVDHRDAKVLFAIDRLGIERLTYARTEHGICLGTSATAVAHAPSVNAHIDQQSLYDFLLMHMVPAPNSIYLGVQKLRPGTLAIFKSGRLTVRHYWQPQFAERTHTPLSQLKDELRTRLQAAVAHCAPDAQTGAFLSGGLDSSSVTGMLAQVSHTPVRTFSMGFGVDDFDELQYARIANQHFGCQAFEYPVTPEDIITAFPKIAQAYDEPFGNSSAVPTYMCALRAREHGITHLLAGDGGDELFGGNERYVRHRLFEAYLKLPAGLRQRLLEPLTQLIPPEGGFTPLRKLRSYIDQARITLPERFESWNFIYRTDTTALLEPEFQRSINPRAMFQLMQEVFDAAPSTHTLHKMLYYDWHFTLADNDLRKVGTMCDLAGVRVSYPMLDQRVVDLSLCIPPPLKIKGLQLRWFYKEAMRGFLPKAILNKSKHGFGLPFGVWLKTHTHLRELIYDHLQDLKQRHIVRATFIDAIIQQHQQGHAGFYGYAIWDLAMLEAWLQAHNTSTNTSVHRHADDTHAITATV